MHSNSRPDLAIIATATLLWAMLVLWTSVAGATGALGVKVDAEALRPLLEGQSTSVTVTILIDDHPLHLQLEPSGVITPQLQRSKHNLPLLLKGTVLAHPGSWVRLAIDRDDFHVANGLLQLDDISYELISNQTSSAPQQRRRLDPPDTPWLAVPRDESADTHTAPHFADHALTPPPAPEPDTAEALPLKRMRSMLRAGGEGNEAPYAMRIGVMIDSRFDEYYYGQGMSRALAVINAVDGFYQAELGLALLIEHISDDLDPGNDPLRLDETVDGESLLNSARTVRNANPDLPADLALVHLFSGHPALNDYIGLGWVGTACRTDGYDLSLSSPFPYDMLLAAHEVGHNLGAYHDDDARCDGRVDARNMVMWPRITSSTRERFSECSLDDMAPSLMASCSLDNIDIALHLGMVNSQSDDPMVRHLALTVHNNDAHRNTGSVRSTTLLPESASASLPDNCNSETDAHSGRISVHCEHGRLTPGSARVLYLPILLGSLEHRIVDAWLDMNQSVDSRTANNRALLDLGTVEVQAAFDAETDPADDAASTGNETPDNNGPNTGETLTPQIATSSGGGALSGSVLSLLALLLTLRRRSALATH